MIRHYRISLPPFRKGFHLITDLILKEIPTLPENGLLHIFIQHTSAGLTINENCDPTVRSDLNSIFNRLAPEDLRLYSHTSEGSDDMPAHAKASLVGYSLSIPIEKGRLLLGTWQGIYLCEFREHGGSRKLIVSVWE